MEPVSPRYQSPPPPPEVRLAEGRADRSLDAPESAPTAQDPTPSPPADEDGHAGPSGSPRSTTAGLLALLVVVAVGAVAFVWWTSSRDAGSGSERAESPATTAQPVPADAVSPEETDRAFSVIWEQLPADSRASMCGLVARSGVDDAVFVMRSASPELDRTALRAALLERCG